MILILLLFANVSLAEYSSLDRVLGKPPPKTKVEAEALLQELKTVDPSELSEKDKQELQLEDDKNKLRKEFSKKLNTKQEAFNQLLEEVNPFTEKQIEELKEAERLNKGAMQKQYSTPNPVSNTIQVDLSPGAQPPVVRAHTNFVSALVFSDSNGQKWPIIDYNLAGGKKFNIKWDRASNVMFLQANAEFASANMVVRLKDLDPPVTIMLVSGQKYVDYKLDLQVMSSGPNSTDPIPGDHIKKSLAKPALISALDGINPKEYAELKTSTPEVRAWRKKDSIIVRSKLALLSPGWSESLSSSDGTKVYLVNVTPKLLLSSNGKIITVTIDDL